MSGSQESSRFKVALNIATLVGMTPFALWAVSVGKFEAAAYAAAALAVSASWLVWGRRSGRVA